MNAPSFLFSALDEETLSLADELNSLGGGDATVRGLSLHAVVNSQINKGDCQVLFNYGESIGIRDVLLPRNHPSSINMKYFPVSSVTHNTISSGQLQCTLIARQLSDWMEQGFNGSLLTMGARGSGKTASLFGDFGCRDRQRNNNSITMIETVFNRLFNPVINKANERRTIALSAWVLQDQRIIDLLANSMTTSSNGRDSLDFACVHCSDLSMACKVLQEARSRAPGALIKDTSIVRPEKERCHFFLQIVLHTTCSSSPANSGDDNSFKDSGSLSTLLIADLLGMAGADGDRAFARLDEDERMLVRANNQQLASLSKVLNEMATTSRSAATGYNRRGAATGSIPPLMRMTSARDAKLSVLLAPALQGNSHCSVVMFLRDGEEHAQEARQVLTTTSGLMDIASACYRVKDVTLRSLHLNNSDSVLAVTCNTNHSHNQVTFSSIKHSVADNSFHHMDADQTANLSGSTDFADMDLSRVLAGDFYSHGDSQSAVKKEAEMVDVDRTREAPPHSSSSEQVHRATSGYLRPQEVSRTMDAFHDLMHSLNTTGDSSDHNYSERRHKSISCVKKSDDEKQETSFAWMSPRQEVLYPPPPPHPADVHSIPHPSRRVYGSGGMQHSTVKDNEERNVNRNDKSAANEGLQRSEVFGMTAALRELQRSASAQDHALIEAEIRRLMGEIDLGVSAGRNQAPARDYRYPDRQEMKQSSASKPHRYSDRYSLGGDPDEEEDDDYLMDRHRHKNHTKSGRDAESVRSSERLSVSFGEDQFESGDPADSLDRAAHRQERDGEIEVQRTYREESYRNTAMGNGGASQDNDTPLFDTARPSGASPSVSPYQSIDSSQPFLSYSDIFQDKLRAMGNTLRRSEDFVSSLLQADDNHASRNGWHQAHTAQIMNEYKESFDRSKSSPSTTSLAANHDVVASSTQSSVLPNRRSLEVVQPLPSVLMVDPAIPDGNPYPSAGSGEDLSETERLRRANSSLMEALREERAARMHAEKELTAARDDILEVRTQCDVDLNSAAIEVKQLRNQLRALCDNHSLTDVFASFEEGVARLTRENAILRQQNLELEMKEMDMLEHSGKFVGSSPDTISPRSNHEKHRMLSKLRKSGQERESLKEQFEVLKAKERQFMLSSKLAQDASRRLRISHQDLLRTKKELDAERLVRADTERDLRLIRSDTLELKQSEGQLRDEKARMVHELAMLRERVATLDDERRRNGQLNKFITKHSTVESHRPPGMMVSDGGTKRGYTRERVISEVAANNTSTGRVPVATQNNTTHDESEPLLNVPVMYDRSFSDRQALVVQGVAGLSNARYSRPEENNVASADLEALLSSMHEGIIATQPSLLPAFRKLSQQIHVDRTRALEQRAKLLEMAFPTSAAGTPAKVNSNAIQKSFSKHGNQQNSVAFRSNIKFAH